MKKLRISRKGRFWLNELIFVGPVLILFLISKGIPSITGFWYSLTDWNGISAVYNYVGLKNFQTLLADNQFWASTWFTLRFALCVVLLTNLIGFVYTFLSTDVGEQLIVATQKFIGTVSDRATFISDLEGIFEGIAK